MRTSCNKGKLYLFHKAIYERNNARYLEEESNFLKELSELTGRSKATVRRWFVKGHEPSANITALLADYLHCDVNEVFEREDENDT